MSKQLMWKWVIALGTVCLSIWLLYPSIDWYTKSPQEINQLEKARLRPKRILGLGLDLRGGTHLVLELDVSKLDKRETVSDALNRAIEIIRNRVDQYGVGETPITRQGERWIAVQLPGVEDPEQAEEIIGKTAMLEFHIQDTSDKASEALSKLRDIAAPFDDKGNLTPEAARLLPAGDMFYKGKDPGTYYVLSATAPVTGAYLQDARMQTGGQMGLPYVSFRFNSEGGKLFDRLTSANIHRYLAIVLDGVVQSVAVINSRISDSGIIEGGDFTLDTAKNLAIVLRAGALPAPVNIIEKRTVGPGLGEDSIKAGLRAAIIGYILVLAFMLFYYRGAGLIADVALFLNLVMLMALMAYFSATLTLPGIAGIILSLAMAVDANVLICERIREEMALGKPLAMCIQLGYDHAWSAIVDCHITTLISGVFLFQFGSGAVKGFAVTLTLGLIISLYTSVFVTRAIYEFWLTSNPKEISI
ncbi:MAG: protein translocase subunit SecD [Elusimicrobiales bacterium]|nr:protein translocase subunit SecD [Elusimicrobiales bacterium]